MKKYIILTLFVCEFFAASEVLNPTCYRDNIKNVVICSDKKLGKLMWQDEIQDFEGTYGQAEEYCKLVNLGGYANWRLPTRIELLSITNKTNINFNANMAFKKRKHGSNKDKLDWLLDFMNYYWSSTKYTAKEDLQKIWVVNFYDGKSSPMEPSSYAFVRCVRQD
ncbi:putative DUF1566 domain protein [Campylobacter showae]|uniref:Lcl C-terminal domain-containing protein n=1 Tax=Campylobacter showae TaxID=204 RepID=UPI000586F3E0|nr:DUF1566 domain-containing protein [Campylobacter showae]QCD49468.1 putative DUF1566 domain protein [Campylobacter showae]